MNSYVSPTTTTVLPLKIYSLGDMVALERDGRRWELTRDQAKDIAIAILQYAAGGDRD